MDFWDKEERARTLSMEDMEARREARKHYKKIGSLGDRNHKKCG